MNPTLIYCYDAYCGWCYGFSPVMQRVFAEYKDKLDFEVLSGGMIIGEQVRPIEKIAGYIQGAYQQVEATTGIRFGKDYLWHIQNPEESDWYMNSEKPAIALCIFKEYLPGRQIEFASDLQLALNAEGRDLDDDEAYRHLLEKYSINPEAFYEKLKSEEYKEQAYYEFALCRQLQVDAFPQVFIQLSETRFILLARGYTEFDDLKARIDKVLSDHAAEPS
ncbi:MAG: DsbA family protein [Chitinophagaceae bacterium]|nr:DsbA family protein [Chitinophagaceae bacterium]MBL0055043.1 DsbA family protein [Chitinophagaceae bacterium]